MPPCAGRADTVWEGMADNPRELLQKLCDDHGLERFSAEEMEALLEDGEEVGWIIEQVLDESESSPAQQLRDLLTAIQAEVAPPPAGEGGAQPEATDEAEPEEGAAGGSGGGLMEALSAGGLDLGGLELPPGVDASQLQQVMSSPRGALLADFSAYCQERGFKQDEGDSPGAEEALRQRHDEWLETPRPSLEGRRPSEVLEGGRLFPEKVETYRREAPKVGRNDPCPCGSGRKYKKCCGRAA